MPASRPTSRSTSSATTAEACQSDGVTDVVVVMMDDLAYGDLACHGSPFVRTPHLDRLHGQSA